jgi:hypothetical protein
MNPFFCHLHTIKNRLDLVAYISYRYTFCKALEIHRNVMHIRSYSCKPAPSPISS